MLESGFYCSMKWESYFSGLLSLTLFGFGTGSLFSGTYTKHLFWYGTRHQLQEDKVKTRKSMGPNQHATQWVSIVIKEEIIK